MARINQQEIAGRLELSQTTVSRSLANHPAINAETKAKVLETAAMLGYRQKIKRRTHSSETGPSVIWGVLISMPKKFSNPTETFQEVLRGIADKSSLHHSILDVVYHDPADAQASDLFRRMRTSKWKGVLLIYPIAPELAFEIANQMATVSIINNYREGYIDTVDVDQCDTIFSLVKLLKEHGHRRIGYLTWRYRVDAPWIMHRLGSFVEALYRLDLEFDPEGAINVHPGDHLEPPQCARRVERLVRKGFTALVCAADHQAYDLISELAKLGIRVPEDVSVTGFDGIAPPSQAKQLATIRVPYEEIGRSATHQLVRRTEQPSAPRQHILVDGTLLRGETVQDISS